MSNTTSRAGVTAFAMLAGLVLAMLALGAATARADTLTASVTPPDMGSAQSPQAHTTTISLSKMDPGVGGNANSAATKIVESLPVDFAATLDRYAVCPSSKVVHGDNKPNCPDGSVLGSVTATAYVPALAFSTNSDQGYIFKIGDNAVRAWIHVSQPMPAGVVVDGTLSRGSAPYGPVVTWDLSSLASGAQAGVEVRTNAAAFTWTMRSGSPSPTPATSPSSGTGTRSSCKAKAKRIKNKRKRRSALRGCTKRKAKKHKKSHKRGAHSAQASNAYAPFVSTGCTGGGWPFHVETTYSDGSKQTADAKVACTAPGSPPPASPPPPATPPPPPSPLCPPLCSVQTSSRVSNSPPPAAETWGALRL